MFERFTDPGRRVVVFSQEEARTLRHDYIGAEHLLLGITRLGYSKAANVLDSLGISLAAVRADVMAAVDRGDADIEGHIPFTPEAKAVLESSLRESLELGHSEIGPQHLLLGLLEVGDGVAHQVLTNLGADVETVRDRVRELGDS